MIEAPVFASPIGAQRVQSLPTTIDHSSQHLATDPKGGVLAPTHYSVTAAYASGAVEWHGKYLCLTKTNDFPWYARPLESRISQISPTEQNGPSDSTNEPDNLTYVPLPSNREQLSRRAKYGASEG